MRAKLLANLNWLFADKVLRLLGGLFIGAWIARYLGPEQFGVLNYAIAFVALFGIVAKLGMDQIVVRNLTNQPEMEGEILGTVFALKFIVALIVLAAVIVIAFVTHPTDKTFVYLVSIIAIGMIFNVFDALDIYYQSHVMSRYTVIARSLSFIGFSAIRIILILKQYPVEYFAVTTTLELALSGLILAIIYKRKHLSAIRWVFKKEIMVSLLKDGWPLILSSALIIIHTRIDQVMIGQLLGKTDVGIYSVAIRLSDVWLFIPIMIIQTITPYMIKLKERDLAVYNMRLIQLYSIMFWLGILVGISSIIFGKFLITILFGHAYEAAYMPLVLTIWTGIFISQAMARSIWMINENRQGYRLAINLIAVLINISLNWYLIPIYGVIGASVASLFSIGLCTWVVPFLFNEMRASNRQLLQSIHPKYLLLDTK